jgi:hypothetical protein
MGAAPFAAPVNVATCLRHSLVVDVAAGAALIPATAELRSIWFMWLARLLVVFCPVVTMCGASVEKKAGLVVTSRKCHLQRVEDVVSLS